MSLTVWRSWLRGRPLPEDALLAAGLLALVAFVAVPFSPRAPFATTDSTAQGAWLLAAACAALVFRRTFPVPVWAFTLLIGAGALAFRGQLAPTVALDVAGRNDGEDGGAV